MTKKELEAQVETLTKNQDKLVQSIREHIDHVDNLMQNSGVVSAKDIGIGLSQSITQLEIALNVVSSAQVTHLFDTQDA